MTIANPNDTGGHQAQRIVGRYVLYDALAAGGMATVHLGRLVGPVGFSRTVAIKRLHDQFALDPDFVPGFLDEARLAARIRHPNVVPTLDVVATEGQLFLVMEYVQGESLSRLLRASSEKKVKVPPRVAIGVMVGALNGLHAAHEAKNEKGEPLAIVHRDVSPQNILVGVDGAPRVLDFGVAKASGRLQTTRSGQLKGKVAYMSPEQLRSEPVDRRSDIFSASIVLWETLTARRLFTGESEGAVLSSVLLAPIVAPSKYAPEIPPALDAIVLKGLEREPAKRWATAREMANALEDALAPATARQVAEWVESLAREALELRAKRVAEIESSSTLEGDPQTGEVLAQIRASSSGSVLAAAGLPDLATMSQSAISVSAGGARPKRRRWLAPAVLAFGALTAVLIALAISYSNHQEHTAAASVTASVTAVASASVAPTSVTAVASVAASATASASAAPTVTAKAVPTIKKPVVDCSNPYTRDELGRKIYKRECLE
jgi:eukaryotic-like serine/threonine-protein kinase